MYEALANAKPDDHLFLLCLLARSANQIESRLAVATERYRYNDKRVEFASFKALTEKFVHEAADIYKTVEVEPSAKARTNIV
jgi:hypothetical protein